MKKMMLIKKIEEHEEEFNEEDDVNQEDKEDENEKRSNGHAKTRPLLLTQATTQATHPEPKLVTPEKDKSCPHCGSVECHATKYGRFLAYLSHLQYKGEFHNEKGDLQALRQ